MQRNLLADLINHPQRETSGADTDSRFDFQKKWAFCRLIDYHIDGNDYLVAFEYHDDVVFFDKENEPGAVDFIQVKTSKSTKPKTTGSLVSRRKSSPSILGKMLANTSIVPESFSKKVILVSNIPFDFSSADICCANVAEKHKSKIIEKLTDELDEFDESILSDVHFQIVNLPVDSIDTLLQGKAVELFAHRFGQDFSVNILSWLRLVLGEIYRRNKFPPDQISTVAELQTKKCIGKSFIDQTLDRVNAQHKPAPDIRALLDQLVTEGWSATARIKVEKQIAQAASDKTDPSDQTCRDICAKISECFYDADLDSGQLSDKVQDVISVIEAEMTLSFPYNSTNYLRALTLLVYYDHI